MLVIYPDDGDSDSFQSAWNIFPFDTVGFAKKKNSIISNIVLKKSGQVSSVGIVTDYGMDGPGSNPGEDEIFRPSRPSLLYNVYWVFRGGKVRPGRAADHSPPSSAAVMEE